MNLVMIGHFKDTVSAQKAKSAIDELTDVMGAPENSQRDAEKYSDGARTVLEKLQFYSPGPAELDQFTYDIRSETKGKTVVITTDEIEVSAFLKLLLNQGARVEVYSAHNHPGTGEGRRTSGEEPPNG